MAPTRTPVFFPASIEGWAEYRRDPDYACVEPSAWMVLRALCECAGYRDASRGVWEGRAGYLAEAAGLSRWTVARHLKVLADSGLIDLERPFGHGDQYAPARIRVLCYEDLRQPDRPGREVQRATSMVQRATHEPLREVQRATHEQGISPLQQTSNMEHVAACENVPMSDAVAARLAPSPDDDLPHEAWEAGRTALRRAKARAAMGTGRKVESDDAYVRAVARRWTPGTPKPRKASPNSPRASEGLSEGQEWFTTDFDEKVARCVECKAWSADGGAVHYSTCSRLT